MVQQNCQLDSPGIYLHPGKRTDNFIVFSVHFSQLDAFVHPESHSLVREGWYFQCLRLSSWVPGENLTQSPRKPTLAAAPFSVLLPMKNGSDKTPAVSIALEIWIALNGGKQTMLLTLFSSDITHGIQNKLMKLDSLLARFLCLPCRGSPSLVRSCQSLSSLKRCWHALGEAKKAQMPIPEVSRVSCICCRWHPPGSDQNNDLSPKPLCLWGCQCSEQDAVLWEDMSLGTEGRSETISTSGVNLVDSIWPILSPFLPIWGLPASWCGSHRHHFSQDFSTVFIFVIAWTPSMLKPQESAGAQSHHS